VNFRDLVDLLAELFGWIGLIAGATCFLIVAILRVSRGSWEETEGVIVDNAHDSQLRWMTTEGELHTRELGPEERASIHNPDELRIHYKRSAPEHISFDPVGHGEKVLRTLGFTFLGMAVLGFVVSIIALFVPR
jgi:hypothetical protein